MSYLKNIVQDLVEKRLWPIAAGLLVLLVAVPLILRGGGTPVPPAGASVAAATPASDTVVTATADNVPAQRSRRGKLRDPFAQPKTSTSTSTAAVAQSSSASSPVTQVASTRSSSAAISVPETGAGSVTATVTPVHTSSSSSSSDSTSSSTPSPSPATSTAPATKKLAPKPAAPPKEDVTTVTVDFGLTGALHRHADIARLAPLPSAANPRFIFLGVLKDRRTAVFLVSSDVEDMLGDGVCRPIPEDCETIELQKGETEFFELTTKDGRWIQYQMDVKDVHVGKVDAAEAIASYARASVAGQKLVRAAALKRGVQALRAYHYVPAQGVLVPAKPRAGARAAGSGPRRYVFGPGEVSVFRTLPAAR